MVIQVTKSLFSRLRVADCLSWLPRLALVLVAAGNSTGVDGNYARESRDKLND
jgi:hypothetical protein